MLNSNEKSVLLSIKPQWAEAILNGDKPWEYRKSAPRDISKPFSAVLYASGEKLLVGEIVVDKIATDNPGTIIAQTDNGPHDEMDLWEYFGTEQRRGSALHVAETQRYDNPVEPYELFEDFWAPPNFNYITNDELYAIRKEGNGGLLKI